MPRFEPREFIRYPSIWPYLAFSLAGIVLAGALLAAFLTGSFALLLILVLFSAFSLFQAFQVIHIRKLSESEGRKIATFEKKILGIESQRRAAFLRSRSVPAILTADETEFLIKTAAPALAISVERNHLNYQANRVLSVEKAIRGRLAAPVATQVLRNLALVSLSGDSLRVLEIGVLFGGAPACFWDSAFGKFGEINFTLLDLFEGYYGESLDPMTGESISQELVAENLKLTGIGQDNYRMIKGDSASEGVIKQLDNEIFDFLLIDGDHSYEGLSSDFQNFAGLVRRGGLILVDDYQNPSWPGVTKYVDEVILKDTRVELLTAGLDTAIFKVI